MKRYFNFEFKQIWFSFLAYALLETILGYFKTILYNSRTFNFEQPEFAKYYIALETPLGLYIIL